MTTLALVQSGWVVDEVPLALPPYRAIEAVALDDTWVGSIGAHGVPDGGRYVIPSSWAVFVTTSDAGVTPLAEFNSEAMGDEGTGTGFTVQVKRDGGFEVMRVRTQPAPTLVTLGQFRFRSFAVSCDDAIAECVVLETNGAVTLWTPSGRRVLLEGVADASHFGSGGGAALHPNGRYLAMAMSPVAALIDLVSGHVTLFRGKATATSPSLGKALDALDDEKSPLSRALERGNEDCISTPQGWNEGRLVIAHSAYGEVGAAPCPHAPFEFDLKTKQRRPVPAYPWAVLDCPLGGWSSSVGTFVTTCTDEISAQMPRGRRLPDGGWEEAVRPDTLPEAVALSPTQIFVMAKPHVTKWQWFKGKAQKRGGLDFVLNGPSVITFEKKGVTVEEVPTWRFGQALFDTPLEDDWHLIRSEREREPVLVRLRQE